MPKLGSSFPQSHWDLGVLGIKANWACSRMVNFAVAVFVVLGGIAKLFPFNDL